MFSLPIETICDSILPHLSVRDLQALHISFDNVNWKHRLHNVFNFYHFKCPHTYILSPADVHWLHLVGIVIVGLNADVNEDVVHLLSAVPTLKHLHVSHKHMLTDDSLQVLARGCPHLEELHLSRGCTNLGVAVLAEYCHQLHTLSLQSSPISDTSIHMLCDHCPNLINITLDGCYELSDASVGAIASAYPHLRAISLLECDSITERAIISLAERCPELQSIGFNGEPFGSEDFITLWAACPNMNSVSIRCCEGTSDEDIISLAKSCPRLKRLSLKFSCITDAAVIAVAEHCPQLTEICVDSYLNLTDASLIALGKHCHKLELIDISYLTNITDVGIAALAEGCPLLQDFYANRTNVSDSGMRAMARGCRYLRKVIINFCPLISITGMSAIVKNCPLISELYISNGSADESWLYIIAQHCRNVTVLNISFSKIYEANAVQAVLESCSQLRVIKVCGCVGLRDKESSVQYLREKFPLVDGLQDI